MPGTPAPRCPITDLRPGEIIYTAALHQTAFMPVVVSCVFHSIHPSGRYVVVIGDLAVLGGYPAEYFKDPEEVLSNLYGME
jgi:hypothetical protein